MFNPVLIAAPFCYANPVSADRYAGVHVTKRPIDLTHEELSALGRSAARQAAQASADAGLPVYGWDEKRDELIVIKPEAIQRKKKVLKAAS
jgi:hypothetical protein